VFPPFAFFRRLAAVGEIKARADSVQPKVLVLHIFHKEKEIVFTGSQNRGLGSYAGLLAITLRARISMMAKEHKRSVQGPDTEAQDPRPPDHHFRLATRGRSIQKDQQATPFQVCLLRNGRYCLHGESASPVITNSR
jgi:hypothetical protein